MSCGCIEKIENRYNADGKTGELVKVRHSATSQYRIASVYQVEKDRIPVKTILMVSHFCPMCGNPYGVLHRMPSMPLVGEN